MTDRAVYTVYILKSEHYDKFYTGCTDDINNRIKQHNHGDSVYTKRYAPWIIHYCEKYINKYDAFAREKYLKSHAGRNWIKKKNSEIH
jgi:predicted GIY-YIG superfamily endonuclease